MADAITASWHGNNYQSRFFWIYAMDLLRRETCVSRVAFEANGPKSFDDVIVHYDPPVTRGCSDRCQVEYFQVKWHTDSEGRFGYEDLIDPKFVGAKTVSILERLRDAKSKGADNSRFTLVTTYRIKDGDPLARLVSKNDHALMLERLFDGTGDRSKMGKVRKLWREHLGVMTDDELRGIVEGLSICDGHLSVQQLRDEINVRANIVGMQPQSATNSDFRYDELARQLKIRKINELNAESLISIAKEEGVWTGKGDGQSAPVTLGIRSFVGLSTQTVATSPDNTLFLNDCFNKRYLNDDLEWQRDIRPRVVEFLEARAAGVAHLRLVMDAHASVAYLAGSVLHLKAGKRIELVQKGRVGTVTWIADDESSGDSLDIVAERISNAPEIAIAIAITQPVVANVRQYIAAELPSAGQLVTCIPLGGARHQAIAGGQHAAQLAEQVAQKIKLLKASRPEARVHVFAACPNSVLFFLGQNHPAIGPVIVYEFDFDGKGNRSYHPSFEIN